MIVYYPSQKSFSLWTTNLQEEGSPKVNRSIRFISRGYHHHIYGGIETKTLLSSFLGVSTYFKMIRNI